LTSAPADVGAARAAAATPPIGERLRALRQLRRQTLREVSERAGLSESFLSQLERGRTNVSISSLQRIASALGVEISDVFAGDGSEGPTILRREARQMLGFGTLGRKALLTPKPFHSIEVVVAEFEPGGSTGTDPYSHGDSEEVCVVLAGTIELEIGGELFELAAGDAARYRSSMPHRVANRGDERADVMYIISPPSY
jgi:transcriptional regulator with XRE-family HTH domain